MSWSNIAKLMKSMKVNDMEHKLPEKVDSKQHILKMVYTGGKQEVPTKFDWDKRKNNKNH